MSRARDRALSFYGQTYPAALHFLGAEAFDEAVRSIATEAYLTCRSVPEEWISYSRRKAFYGSTRYRRTAYTYTSVVRAVDFLAGDGWLEHRKVSPGNLGWQSSFRASPKLMAVIDPATTLIEWDTTETIVLRDRKDKQRVEYRDTRETVRMRRNLAEINEAMSSARVAHPDLGVISVGAPTKIGHANAGPARHTLSRVFNGNFNQGGRFYGAFWVSLPKQERMRLTLDGHQVAELDYRALHPTLLYAEACKVFQGDPYDIAGYPATLRKLIKVAFNTMVNASNRKEAHWSILQRARELTETGDIPTGYSSPSAINTLLDAIEYRHRSIRKAFYSDAGIKLMRKDSALTEQVTLGLARQGIIALPVHDSFITRAECAPQLGEAMQKALQSVLKTTDDETRFSCQVSVSIKRQISPTVPHIVTVPHNGRDPSSSSFLPSVWFLAGLLPPSDGLALILGVSGVFEKIGARETQKARGCLSEQAHDTLLPFGIEQTDDAWLHSRCWDAWHAGRKAEAVALSTFGIYKRTSP